MSTSSIRIAIAGVGNCASSLVQGIYYYSQEGVESSVTGLARPVIGQYKVGDLLPVAAYDIDVRKVGQPLNDAIFHLPNNTKVFHRPPVGIGPIVQMATPLDGVSAHMTTYPDHQRFIPSDAPAVNLVDSLRSAEVDVLVNYMPVGAQKATEAFAGACLEANVAFVNAVPCFVVSDPVWANRFRTANLPCVGDDIKAQLGATITHRTLARLFQSRGVQLETTYQLNTGGNTDFLNMLNRDRLSSKKTSKTEAVQSQLDPPLAPDNIHIGPSDFVPFLKDNKVCFMRLDGTGFGGLSVNVELRLSVEDSPNSAGMVVDAIRCCMLAKQAGMSGPLEPVCALTMKHPPVQLGDDEAVIATERLIDRAHQIVTRKASKTS